MKSGAKKKVLVIGDDMRIFLAVARSLGRAGMEVHAVPFDPHSPALTSRYVRKVHHLPAIADDTSRWVSGLVDVLGADSFDLVIPCCERAIIAIDLHRSRFAACRMAMPNPAMMTTLFDKEKTHELCLALGIPVVSEITLGASTSAADLGGQIPYPIVLKPRKSYWSDRLETWGKVFILEREAELAQTLNLIGDRTRYLAQSYFEGEGVGVSVLAREGRILQAFQHRRLRERKGGVSTCRISEAVNPELLEACAKICQSTALTGVSMFEFRVNLQSHKWVLIEVNARFWGSMPLPLALGVDFPVLLCDLLVDGREPEAVAYRAGAVSRNLMLDGVELLSRLRKLRRNSLLPWLGDAGGFMLQPLRWLTGAERSDSFVLDDLRPAFQEITAVLGQLTRQLVRPVARMLRLKRV